MSRRAIFLILIFFQNFYCYAQEGEYFLTHHKYVDNKFSNENFDIEEDKRGFLYFANKNGVVQYDGNNWELISCPASVYDLCITGQNRVYVAGKMGFGYLRYRLGTTKAQYVSLWESTSRQSVCKIAQQNDSIFFLSDQSIFIYIESKEKLISISPPENDDFYNIFSLGGQMLAQTGSKKFFAIHGDKAKPFNPGLPENERVIFSCYDSSARQVTIVGTDENRLFSYENRKMKPVKIQDEDYIGHSEINSCQWVDSDLMALGTFRGGVVFLKVSTGKIEKIVNYRTGLPDNGVQALGKDREHGIWVAHEYGFTRIAPDLPFRNYSTFPGIEGNLLSVAPYEGTIYVGTSTGLYYLETVKDYQEVVRIVQREETKVGGQQDSPAKKERRKWNPFSFLKSKKDEESKEAKSNDEEEKKKAAFFRSIFFRKREINSEEEYKILKEKELKSIRYTYKAVEGFYGKSSDLKHSRNNLIAGGAAGLFEIKNGKAITIDSSRTPAFSLSNTSDLLFSFAAHQTFKVFAKSQSTGTWGLKFSMEIGDDIVHINPVDADEIWLSSKNAVYQITGNIRDGYVVNLSLPIENAYNDDICSFVQNGSVYFVTTGGYYCFNPNSNTLIRDKAFNEKFGRVERVIVDHHGIWIFNGETWISPSNGGTEYPGLNILGFFKHIKSLYTDENKKQFWVITATNELFKASPSEYGFFKPSYSILLKEVRNKDGIPLPVNNLRINQDESFLTFEFVHPDYTGLLDIEYQYKLVGLSDQWTEWTKNPILSHQMLPPGPYELVVRIRNALGEISEENLLDFKVVPHYWRTWWFYLLEIVFFSSLLWLTYFLNRHEKRDVFVSRLLTLFTLILIVEFIQILVESYWLKGGSPVINFFLQAAIALFIVPVEKKLRKFLSGK